MTQIRCYPVPISQNNPIKRPESPGRPRIRGVFACCIVLCLICGIGQAYSLENATSEDRIQIVTKLYLNAENKTDTGSGESGASGGSAGGTSGSGGSSGAVLLWTSRFPAAVTTVDIRADGAVVPVGTANGNITLLNSSGTTLWTVPSGDPVSAVGITDGGDAIVAGTGNRLMLLDAGGNVTWTVDTESRVLGAEISPDGDYCAAGTAAGDLFVTSNRGNILWKVSLGSAVNTVAVGSEGALIVAGTEDGSIHLLNATGDLLWTHGAGRAVRSVSLTGDGAVIAAGTAGGTIIVLDAGGRGDPIWTAESAASAVHLNADGATLGAGTSGGYAYRMNDAGIKTWQYGRMKSLNGENCAVTAIALSSSADYQVIGSDNQNVYYFRFTSRLPPTVTKEPEPVAPASTGDEALAVTTTTPAAGVAVAEALTPQEAPGFCAAVCLGAIAIVAVSRRRGR